MNLAISIDKPGPGTAVATMVGHLDVYSAPDARDALIGLINEARYRQVADLTRVEFLDSTGLAVLVGAWKRARAHGSWCGPLTAPDPRRSRWCALPGGGCFLAGSRGRLGAHCGGSGMPGGTCSTGFRASRSSRAGRTCRRAAVHKRRGG